VVVAATAATTASALPDVKPTQAAAQKPQAKSCKRKAVVKKL
jgi:hypothetical protein